MTDQEKTREELIAELDTLRRQIAEQDTVPDLRRAAALFEWAPLGIHECDIDGMITFVNPSQEAITGFTADELVGTYVWDRVPAGPHKDSLPAYFKYLASEQPTPTPFFAKNVRKSGEIFDVRVDWNYIRNCSGEVTGFVSVVSDITEWKQAEVALREAKESNDRLIASMGDGFSVLDTDGVHVEVNDALCRMTGFDRDELIGVGLPHPYWPPEHLDHIQQTLDEVARGGTQQFELTFMRKSGERFPVIVAPSQARNKEGTVVNCFATVKDISRRKQIEEKLRENERRLSTLMSNLPGAVYRCQADENWTIEFLSDGYLPLTGYEPSELIGQPGTRHHERLHPDDHQRALSTVIEAINQKKSYQVEYRLCTASGEEKWLWERGSGVYADDGTLEAIEGFTADISPQKYTELELRKARAQLEQRVEERTMELTKANEQLRAEVEQRRQAEADLTIFRRFVESSTQGFGMADLNGQIIYANPFLARLFGAETPDDVIGTHVSTYYPADYLARRDREIVPALRHGQHWRGEQMLVFPDGQMHPTIHAIFPVLDDNGDLHCSAAVITDITELKRVEKKLRQSEERYRTVVEDQTEVICRLKQDGTFVFVNDVYCRFFGKSKEELLGKQWQPAALNEDLPLIEERLRALSPANPVVVSENRVHSGLGKVRWMQFVNRGLFDDGGRLAEIQSVGRDITERKQADEVVRQTLDQLATIYDGITEGLLITDIETKRFVRVNAAFCRMLGYSEEELLTKAIKDIHPAQEVSNDEQRFQAAAEGRVFINEERPVLRKDGGIFYADITGHRVFYNNRPCLLALFRDVTERRQSQEAIRKEQESLYRMLQASDRERELITYDIHDGVAQLLLGATMLFKAVSRKNDAVAKEVLPTFNAGLAALKQASAEARSLMNRTRTPVLQSFGLRPAVADFIDQFRNRLNTPEIIYHCETPFGRLEPALENTIFRVAQEAITNACIHSKGKSVRVAIIQRDDEVTIEVQDDGVGFDTSAVKENRFGLYGIRERVRLLGKGLKIESASGQGTRIEATFPLIYRKEEAD